MTKHHKPREGSTGFGTGSARAGFTRACLLWPDVKEAVPIVFAGYKAGMTSVSYINPKKGSATENQENHARSHGVGLPAFDGVRSKALHPRLHTAPRTLACFWSEKLPKDLGQEDQRSSQARPQRTWSRSWT